jgi:hypothetical protein
MNTIKALIERHPLLSYFALTFAISWGAILLAVGLVLGDSLPPHSSYRRRSRTQSQRWFSVPVWLASF